MPVGPPKGNANAETWTEEEARSLFDEALVLSNQDEYDFIGEIARKLDTYRQAFPYLSDKYPALKPLYTKIQSNVESNCFSHSKNGLIKEATAIMNLKSNYRWTDRNDHTTLGEKIEKEVPIINVYNTSPPLAEAEDNV